MTQNLCVGSDCCYFHFSLLNFGMLCLAALQSWRTRNLSTEYQESQYLLRAVIGMLLVIFIGGPVLFIAQDNSNASLFISSAIIFSSCMLILLLIFVPKLQFAAADELKKSKRRLNVSGLDTNSTNSNGTGATKRLSLLLPQDSSYLESHHEDESEDFGERIYSNKDHAELVQEVESLKKYIKGLKARQDALGAAASAPSPDTADTAIRSKMADEADNEMGSDSSKVRSRNKHQESVRFLIPDGADDEVAKGTHTIVAPKEIGASKIVKGTKPENGKKLLGMTVDATGETIRLPNGIVAAEDRDMDSDISKIEFE